IDAGAGAPGAGIIGAGTGTGIGAEPGDAASPRAVGGRVFGGGLGGRVCGGCDPVAARGSGTAGLAPWLISPKISVGASSPNASPSSSSLGRSGGAPSAAGEPGAGPTSAGPAGFSMSSKLG